MYTLIHMYTQIQTTSPEKFRVRPRCGYLAPSETVSVNIMLKQDYHLGESPKDKFLVMCMPAPVGIEPSQQSMSEAWKMKPQNGNDVEQHRLTCNYRSSASAASTPGTCACGKTTVFNGGPDEGFASTKSTNTSDVSRTFGFFTNRICKYKITSAHTYVYTNGMYLNSLNSCQHKLNSWKAN